MPRARRRKRPAAAPPPLRGAEPVEYSIDLHGLRAKDAIRGLERHIQTNYAAGQPWVEIVHGRGTGALREAVQNHLKKHRLVARYYYAPHNTGGDGVTIADLDYAQTRTRRREIETSGGPTDFDRRR
jgi:DNA mismatch repair protein MutS2